MRDKNPNDANAISNDKSWNANSANDRLGWLTRNSMASDHMSVPSLLYPLGTVTTDDMARFNVLPESKDYRGWEHPIWRADSLANNGYYNGDAVPGILSYQFDQHFGSGFGDTRSGIAKLFKQWWIDLRFDQAMTEDWQPGDLHFLQCAYMNMRMHLENVRRLLKLMRRAQKSADNKYYDAEALLAACGFPIKISDLTLTKVNGWIDKFNDIIGNVRKLKFFDNMIPGQYRWESLVREIYKDTSADTTYTQMMVLAPRHFYRPMQVDYQPTPDSPLLKVWAMVKDNNFKYEGRTISYFHYTQVSPHDYSEDAEIAFSKYLQAIEDDIDMMFYDSGLIKIMVTIKAKPDSIPFSIKEIEIDYFDKDAEGKDDFRLTWDFKMVLALHNASVVPLNKSYIPSQDSTNLKYGAWVDPKEGILVEQNNVYNGNTGYYLQAAAKVINLPTMNWSYGDIYNAVQWAYVGDPDFKRDIPGLTFSQDVADPACLGPDSIGNIQIYTYSHRRGGQKTADATSWKSEPVLRSYRFSQCVFTPSDPGSNTNPYLPENEIGLAPIDSERLVSAFFCAPIRYWMAGPYQNGSNDDFHWTIYDISGDRDCMFALNYDTCRKLKNQITCNYWGYPLTIPKEGTPDFTSSTAITG